MFTSHLSFRFEKALVLTLAVLTGCIFTNHYPVEWGYENSLVENLQMAVLGVGVLLCLTAKTERPLFSFASLVILFQAAREVSYGRTIFGAVPGQVDTFYKWSELPCGRAPEIICIALLAGGMVYLFIRHRLYLAIWRMLTQVRFPVFIPLLMLPCVAVAMIAEKQHLPVMEELGELAFYITMVTAVYSYSRERLPKV